jgi:hypothetical protein
MEVVELIAEYGWRHCGGRESARQKRVVVAEVRRGSGSRGGMRAKS